MATTLERLIEGWARQARELGQQAARDAATWTEAEDPVSVLAMLDDGDPAADDYLPVRPTLSGEWADAPTPRTLFEEVTGLDAHAEATWDQDKYNRVVDALCGAWEDGVDDVFEHECVRELRAMVAP